MRVISIDLGASSGRCFVFEITAGGQITMEEIHRFPNGIMLKDGRSYWDLDKLWLNAYDGIAQALKCYDDIASIAVDSWGLDFICLDRNDKEIRPYISYRDARTKGMMKQFCEKTGIDNQALFALTAAQLLEFNTLYQFFALKENNPEILEQTHHILFIPDWFHFKLTGKKAIEITNASTTQILDAKNKKWSQTLLDATGVKIEQLPPLREAGTPFGEVKADMLSALGAKQKIAVTLPSTHDTASAVVAVPSVEPCPYFISLGTWAIVGREIQDFDVGLQDLDLKIGTEVGVFNTYRKSKNAIGLWLIQNVKKELCPHMSYAEIVELAKKEPAGRSFISPNDASFFNPPSMATAIQDYCAKTKQYIPQTIGEISRCIFDSLACCLADTLSDIAQGSPMNKVYIIGGGAQNYHLCQILADIMNIEVSAGPFEATVIGNAVMQFIGLGAIADIATARKMIKQSFSCEVFQPQSRDSSLWAQYHKIVKNP